MCPGESKHWSNQKQNITLENNASGSLLNSPKENGHSNSHSNIQGFVRNDPEANKRKWRIFGQVLDRFFFLVYFSTLVFAFIFIFPKPHMIMQILWRSYFMRNKAITVSCSSMMNTQMLIYWSSSDLLIHSVSLSFCVILRFTCCLFGKIKFV